VVPANLRLVTHTAEPHAHEGAPGRPRDRFAERGLARAGRADQAQDRSGQLVEALLDRKMLDDALLDLLQPVMVVVDDLLRERSDPS
jgi:hypothetical protein